MHCSPSRVKHASVYPFQGFRSSLKTNLTFTVYYLELSVNKSDSEIKCITLYNPRGEVCSALKFSQPSYYGLSRIDPYYH